MHSINKSSKKNETIGVEWSTYRLFVDVVVIVVFFCVNLPANSRIFISIDKAFVFHWTLLKTEHFMIHWMTADTRDWLLPAWNLATYLLWRSFHVIEINTKNCPMCLFCLSFYDWYRLVSYLTYAIILFHLSLFFCCCIDFIILCHNIWLLIP